MKAKNIPYVAIYTGLQPSRVSLSSCLCFNLGSTDPTSHDLFISFAFLQVIPEFSMSNQHVGRSLLQTVEVKPPIFFNRSNAPCIMLWAEKLNVAVSDSGEWIDLAAQTPSLTGSDCNTTSSQ